MNKGKLPGIAAYVTVSGDTDPMKIVAAMVKAVKIPVTVKMRAGWNESQVNAPELARMVEAAGASAVAVHGRTAAQAYHGLADWALIARVAESVKIPVVAAGGITWSAPFDSELRLHH